MILPILTITFGSGGTLYYYKIVPIRQAYSRNFRSRQTPITTSSSSDPVGTGTLLSHLSSLSSTNHSRGGEWHSQRVSSVCVYIYIYYTYLSARQNPLHRSSCYYRLSLLGGIRLSSVLCHYRVWAGAYRFTVFRAHLWQKTPAELKWSSTILTLTHTHK